MNVGNGKTERAGQNFGCQMGRWQTAAQDRMLAIHFGLQENSNRFAVSRRKRHKTIGKVLVSQWLINLRLLEQN